MNTVQSKAVEIDEKRSGDFMLNLIDDVIMNANEMHETSIKASYTEYK